MGYEFTCSEQKRIRLIINTDAKNEADDQFAIVHHLLSEKMIVKGLIGAHFEKRLGKELSVDTSTIVREATATLYRCCTRPANISA